MHSKKSQAGFTHVVLVLMIVVIAVAAFAFYRVQQMTEPTDTTETTTPVDDLVAAEGEIDNTEIDVTADQTAIEADLNEF